MFPITFNGLSQQSYNHPVQRIRSVTPAYPQFGDTVSFSGRNRRKDRTSSQSNGQGETQQSPPKAATFVVTAAREPDKTRAWVVDNVTRELVQDAKSRGLRATVVQKQESPKTHQVGTTLVRIERTNPFRADQKQRPLQTLKGSWQGAVEWQGSKSPFKREKTTKCRVSVSPLDKCSPPLPTRRSELESDTREDRFKATGPGGQKRNKTESAIRLTHIPSGISVTGTEEVSQHKNRANAWKRLEAKMADHNANLKQQQQQVTRQLRTEALRSKPIRRYTGPDFKLKAMDVKATAA